MPVPVGLPVGVSSFTQFSTGEDHSCALDTNGRAYCWGRNFCGALGNGTYGDQYSSSMPVPVTMPAGVTFTKISAGGICTVCALDTHGNAYCWWGNTPTIPLPVPMPAGVSFSQIAAGSSSSAAALDTNGNAYSLSSNRIGSSYGVVTTSSTPVAVTMPAGVSFTQISQRYDFTCAIDTNGKAYCWGTNSFGELGNGTRTNSSTPVPVTMPTGVNFTQIQANSTNACALGDNGKTYCWGLRALPNGTQWGTSSYTPVAITTPAGVNFTQISYGYINLGNDGFASGRADLRAR
jgi:alpha-tubulin suppressor-like RCC1 family protein